MSHFIKCKVPIKMQYNVTAELNSYQNRLVKQYHQQKPMFCIQIIIIIIIKQRLSFEDIFRLSISQIKNINKKQAIYKVRDDKEC